MAVGAAILGAGASLYSANRSANAQENAANQATESAERIAAAQLQAAQPFLDRGVQAQDALRQILGLPAQVPSQTNSALAQIGVDTGPTADYAGYVNANPDLVNEYSRVRNGGFGPNLPSSYDFNGDGQVGRDEYGAFHYETFGRNEGRDLGTIGGTSSPTSTGTFQDPSRDLTGIPGADPNIPAGGTPGPAQNSGAYDPRTAFENSLFYTSGENSFQQDRDRLDNLSGSSGSFFSGQSLLAQEEARERNFGNAFGQYTNALASLYGGGQVAAGQQQNALAQLGNAQQTAAYQRGAANAGFWGQVGDLGAAGIGFALG